MRSVLLRRLLLCAFCLQVANIAPAFAEEDYKLGPQDRIKIRVQEWPDVNGEYMVSPEGQISLPIIGSLKAAGFGVEQLGDVISSLLQQRTGGQASLKAAIEISQFRPFFVLGDVQKPGEYAFRPGMTVLQAVVTAGGYYRPSDPGLLRLQRDVLQSEGERAELKAREVRLRARAARIEASLASKADVVFDGVRDKSSPIFDEERRIFVGDRETVDRLTKELDDTKALYKREIQSLATQMDAMKRQETSVQKQLDSMQALSGRGLALESRQLDLERISGQIASERLALQTASLRAEQGIAAADQKLRDQLAERRRLLMKDALETRDELERVVLRQKTVEALAREASVSTPTALLARAAKAEEARKFSIIRKASDGAKTIQADEQETLEPGDVLKVAPQLPDGMSPDGQAAALN